MKSLKGKSDFQISFKTSAFEKSEHEEIRLLDYRQGLVILTDTRVQAKNTNVKTFLMHTHHLMDVNISLGKGFQSGGVYLVIVEGKA